MKRHAFLLASIAALAPFGAASLPTMATAGGELPHFLPPSNGVLTRTVWRYLSTGEQIVVTRRYAVRFAPSAEGFRLDGDLIEARVEAPAELDAFADLERQRPDTTFPILLDRRGTVVAEGGPPSAEVRTRLDKLLRVTLGNARIDPQAKADALAQVPVISAAGAAGAPFPADFFRAKPGARREVRKIGLPGGDQGEVEVATRIDDQTAGAPSRQVERVVTTRLAGTTKVSREVWSLTAS